MVSTLLLTFIPLLLGGGLASLVSGGSLHSVLDLPDFLGVFVIFALCIFISDYGKSFCRIFLPSKKFEQLSLEQLHQTEIALKTGSKILLYTALFFPTLNFIQLLANTPWECRSDIGPNSAITFLSGIYLCLFEMSIYTMQAKVRKSVILYMAEIDEEREATTRTQNKSVVKVVVGVILLALVCWTYAFSYFGFVMGTHASITTIIDLPSLVCILIFVIPLIAISGNLGNLLGGIGTLFSNSRLNVAKKNLYLNAVETTGCLNWFAAITATGLGWISMMNYQEDATTLFPNIAVSMIPLFYAVVFNLFLLLVESRIRKVSA